MGGDGLRPGRFFQAGGESKSEFFRDPSGMVGQHFPSFSASGFTKPRRSAQNDAKNSHFVWENAENQFFTVLEANFGPKTAQNGHMGSETPHADSQPTPGPPFECSTFFSPHPLKNETFELARPE